LAPASPRACGQPGAGRAGVGQGLLGGEGLGDHDDQGRFRIHVGRGQGELGAVDIGHEAQIDARLDRPQGVPQQAGAQVAAADPDVQDGLERLAGGALDLARADGLGEGLHPGADRLDLGHDRLAAGLEVGVGLGAQGGVQDGAAL
jgi:hypothetical protein